MIDEIFLGTELQALKCSRNALKHILGSSDAEMVLHEKRGAIKRFDSGELKGHIDLIGTIRAVVRGAKVSAEAVAEDDAENEYRKHRARSAKVAADRDEGLVAEVADVEAMRESEIQRAKARLLGIAAGVVVEVSPYLIELEGGKAIIEMIRERVASGVFEALEELSRDDVDELEEFEDESEAP